MALKSKRFVNSFSRKSKTGKIHSVTSHFRTMLVNKKTGETVGYLKDPKAFKGGISRRKITPKLRKGLASIGLKQK